MAGRGRHRPKAAAKRSVGSPKKASAKGRKKSAVPKSASKSKVVADATDTDVAAPKRALERRDTDDQVERAVGKKLAHIPKSVVLGRKNKHGRNILEEAAIEIRTLRPTNGKLGSKWWMARLAEFKFTDGAYIDLPVPDGNDVPEQWLLDALDETHGANEVNAVAFPLEFAMETCSGLGPIATYGLLRGIEPSITLPYHVAAKCLVAVFGMWASTGDNVKYPEMFSYMKPHGDAAIKFLWEHLSDNGVLRGPFLETYSGHLSILTGLPEAVGRIVLAEDHAKNCPVDVRQLCTQSIACEAIFAADILTMSKTSFSQTIRARVADLEHLSYETVAVQAFYTSVNSQAAELAKRGSLSFGQIEFQANFLGKPCGMVVYRPLDEAKYVLYASALSVAINSGKVPMMPWEELCFDVGHAPGVLSVMAAVPPLLTPLLPARKACKDLIGHGPMTIKKMVTTVQGKEKTLAQLSPTIAISWTFLYQHAETCILQRLHTQILAELPDEAGDDTPAKVANIENDA
jgi:hypothetical protein